MKLYRALCILVLLSAAPHTAAGAAEPEDLPAAGYPGSVGELLPPPSLLGERWERSDDFLTEDTAAMPEAGGPGPEREAVSALQSLMGRNFRKQGVRAAANVFYLDQGGSGLSACDVRILLFADTERADIFWRRKSREAGGFQPVSGLGEESLYGLKSGQIRLRRGNVSATLTPVGEPGACRTLALEIDTALRGKMEEAGPAGWDSAELPRIVWPEGPGELLPGEACREVLEKANASPDVKLIPELGALLNDREDPECQIGAVGALEGIGGPEAIEALHQGLGQWMGKARVEAIRALGNTGDDAAIEPLMDMLKGDRISQLEAAKALSLLNRPKVLHAIRRELKKLGEYDHEPRIGLLKALVRIGYRGGYEILLSRYLSDPALVEMDYNTWDAMADIGESVIAPLIEECRAGKKVICEALPGLLDSIGTPAVDPLLAALRDESPVIRRTAATTLGRILDRRAVGPLITALHDEDGAVRNAAAFALGYFKSSEAVPDLVSRLADRDKSVRGAVHSALLAIGPSCRDNLLAEVDNPSPFVRTSVFSLLKYLCPAEGAPPAMEALADPEWQVRLSAAGILSRMQITESLPALVALLQEAALANRRDDVQSLGFRIGDFHNAAVPFLLPLSAHPDARVRAAAVRGYSEAVSPEALAVLEASAVDPAPQVRSVAEQQLSDYRRFETALEEVRSGDTETRRRAASAIQSRYTTYQSTHEGELYIFRPIADDSLLDSLFALVEEPEPVWSSTVLLAGLAREDHRIRKRLLGMLTGMLENGNRKQRKLAIDSLLTMDVALATELLLDELEKSGRQPESEDLAVVQALAELEDPRAKEAVLRWSLSALGGELTSHAAQLLGKVRDPRAVPPMIREMETTERNRGKREIIYALGDIGDRRAVPSLARIVTLDFDMYGRERAAAGALKKLTGVSFATLEKWRSWWESEKR